MASLTESAETARKVIKYGAIGFVGISLLWYLAGWGFKLYRYYFPVAPPPPETGFGKLEPIKFPPEQGRPALLLELPTGVIPTFPDRMLVYQSPLKRSSFLNANKAIEMASMLGFTFKPNQISKTKYMWDSQDQLDSKLEMNIVTNHFVMKRRWQNDPSLLTTVRFQSDKQVISEAISLLRKSDVLPDDILGEEKISYLKADSGKLVPALSLSDSDFVQVDFFRKNMEEIDSETQEILSSYPFYRPQPEKGVIRLILSGSTEINEKLILIDNDYNKVEYQKFTTYPIKTGTEAWEELKNGGGFVTDNSPDQGTTKIRRIFLGYFDGSVDAYTMPVYIFLGDKNFVAYVSAITNDWLK